MNRPLVFIMAGGDGKRMCSNIPKVLHKIQDKPMIVHVIENSYKLSPLKIIVIVGKYHNIIENTIKDYIPIEIFNIIDFSIQQDALGTGNAIKCGVKDLKNNYNSNTPIIILSGDIPLVTPQTMKLLLEDLNNAKIMTTMVDDPSGYGRVIIQNNKFKKIIEDKDCDTKQLLNKNINTGIYSITLNLLSKYIFEIDNKNSKGEYYLTDLFGILVSNNISIDFYQMEVENQIQLTGVNTKEQLHKLNVLLQNNKE